MSPDPKNATARAVEAMAAFGAWWARELAVMHQAKAAAPSARPWQGPPYLMQPGRRLRMSLDERLMHARIRRNVAMLTCKAARAKEAAQLRYLVARDARDG